MADYKKRLDTLIRQGLMPAKQLPILHRALNKLKVNQVLNPYERESIAKLMDKMIGFQFGDDITYQRARLHTQKTRYQTEELTVAEEKEEIVVHDGSEDEADAKKDKKVKKNGKSKLLKTNKGDGMKPEEEINEVSDTLKKNYIKKANKEITSSEKRISDLDRDDGPHTIGSRGADNAVLRDIHQKGINKRRKGVVKARSKLGEALGNRPADKDEGDKESPKQGGSVKPEIIDGPKQDAKPSIKEGLSSREEDEARFARIGKKRSKIAAKASKKNQGIDESILKFNDLYKKNLETALGNNEVDNVRDIPESIKSDLFKHLDEATASKKQIKMAKGIAFDKRYKGGNMTGAAKQMEKIKKGLSDHPEVSNALRRANEETEIEKTPNQKIRDVHNTVKDILQGKTIEVSDEPLVVDPNVESQAELDRTVNVQEGAREDALRDIKRDSGKGMAPVKKDPKPGKSKHDGSENKGPEHIVSQLRKAISLGDKHDGVKFQDGNTHKVKASHAHKFLNKYMSGKPADKEKMQSHGHASHDNFKKHID